MNWWTAAERVLLSLWVGALWAVGYVAAPVLFMTLDDRALAGSLAGAMFTVVAYLSLLCGGLLLLLQGWRPGRWRRWPLLAMLGLVAIGEFGLRPEMVAGSAGFASLHGIARAIYLLVSLLGLALVAAGPRERSSSRRWG